jgi:HemY protein
MIRVILFLIAVGIVATGFVWLADRPGDVVITWLGYRAETSLMVAALAVAALVLAAIFVWSVFRAIVRSPAQVSLFMRNRRAMKGYLAISRGMVAIGAGDLRLARKSAGEAARLSPGDPLTLLLTAQSAQMAGDRATAEQAFRDMAGRDDTKLLGLRGLYIEAQRRNDTGAMRGVAEAAIKAAPGLTWAGQALLDGRSAAADWAGALDTLERMRPGLDKADYRRKRAVLLTARAQALATLDRDASRAAALEAVKLAPDLVPAAALAGRYLAESNEPRKASRILAKAWTLQPHPDIAEAYANVRLGDSAREKLVRMQKFAAKTPGQLEGAIAVAWAAIDARDFVTARAALAAHSSAPTRRVATLMAEIEDLENGDQGRVREWMSRAVRASGDPVWTADGVVSDRWLPVSPDGRLDGYQWRVPFAELGGVVPPVIDAPPPAGPSVAIVPDVNTATPMRVQSDAAVAPAPSKPIAPAPPAKAAAAPVVPLVHAPDDPGADPDANGESVETATGRSAWGRISQLFR